MLNNKTLVMAAALVSLNFASAVQAEHVERITYTDGSYRDVVVGDPIEELVYVNKCSTLVQGISFIGLKEYKYYTNALYSAMLSEHPDATKLDIQASHKQARAELLPISNQLLRDRSRLRYELEQCYSNYMEAHDYYGIAQYERESFSINPFHFLGMDLRYEQKEASSNEIAPWFEKKVQKYCVDLGGSSAFEEDCRFAKLERDNAIHQAAQRQASSQEKAKKLAGYLDKLPAYCAEHGTSPVCWEPTYDNLFFYNRSEVQGAGTAYGNWLKRNN
ncbi:hypothetical protein [Vibrio phage vB_VmeM-Yong XC32]|nr:hypothetical protein [Vibrio phage vB_VmeM-Yong XC31]QAX96537.1 hypothetical protein [Vibrio phage vB_VmeM-Yong XC32]QAX96855.1 hypothetical protein [Vibrio phage vB_VmeM-Yong MS31]QAX97160.1 hypothetical protein [Vibrio phage vB_VmeM-Yong MS32]